MSGELLALILLTPRIRMVGLLAAGSLLSTICTPATLPLMASMASLTCRLLMSSLLSTPAGTGEALTLLLTEGHHDDIVKALLVGGKRYLHVGLDGNLLRLHAHIGNDKGTGIGWKIRQLELAVDIRDGTHLGTLNTNGSSGNGLTVVLGGHHS